MTKFQSAVLSTVRAIPHGQIASYGQIAVYVGLPRAARQVGWTMRELDADDFPWWRVVNNAGRISIKGNIEASADQQKDLLTAEGIQISDDLKFDIEKYRWHPDSETLEKLVLPQNYLEKAAQNTPFQG